MEKSPLKKLLDAAVIIAVSAYLIYVSVSYIWSIKLKIAIIIGAVALVVSVYRLVRYILDQKGWRKGGSGDEIY